MMHLKSFFVSAVALCCAFCGNIFAAEVVVSGGNWSTFGINSGDDVTVTGSSVNDVDDLTLGTLKLSGTAAMQVTGKAVTLTSALQVEDASIDALDQASVTFTLALDGITAANDLAINVHGYNGKGGYSNNTVGQKMFSGAPTRTLVLNTPIDFGTYKLTRNGWGRIDWMCTNTGTGLVTIDRGENYVKAAEGPFGTGELDIYHVQGSSMGGGYVLHANVRLCGTKLLNRIVKDVGQDGAGNNGPMLRGESGVNIITGMIYRASGPFNQYVTTTATNIFEGGFSGNPTYRWGDYVSGFASTADGPVVIRKTPFKFNSIGTSSDGTGCGWLRFEVAGNEVKKGKDFYLGRFNDSQIGKLDLAVDWALNAIDDTYGAELRPYSGRGYGQILLHGTKQRIGGWRESDVVSYEGSITGDAGSVLYSRQWITSSNPTIGVNVLGGASFVKEGPYPLTMRSSASTTSGRLQVTEGTLTLTAAARFTAISDVVIGKAASDEESRVSASAVTPKLVVNAVATLPETAALKINGAGVLDIAAGLYLKTPSFVLDGETMPGGIYSSEDCPEAVDAEKRAAVMAHFAGAGQVQVGNGEARETIWRGQPGDSWGVAANWSNGKPSSDAVIIFTNVAETVAYANDVAGLYVKGVRLVGAGNVTLSGSELRIGNLGLTIGTNDQDTATETVTLDLPFVAKASQDWNFYGTNRTVKILRGFSGAGDVARKGAAKMEVHGVSTATGAFSLATTCGWTTCYGESPLGRGNLTVNLDLRRPLKDAKGQNVPTSSDDVTFRLHNTVLSNAVVKFTGKTTAFNSGSHPQCWFWNDDKTTNTIAGALGTSGSHLAAYLKSNSELYLEGGADTSMGSWFIISDVYNNNPYNYNTPGRLVIRNKAFVRTGTYIGMSSSSKGLGTASFEVAGNHFSKYLVCNAKLYFTVDWAIGSEKGANYDYFSAVENSTGAIGKTGGTLYLGATKQRFNGITATGSGTTWNTVIDRGMTVNGDAGSELHYCEKNAGRIFKATYNGGASFVKEGAATVQIGGTWNSKGVIRIEAGAVSVKASEDPSFLKRAPVEIADGATLNLPEAGQLYVRSLKLGDTQATPGAVYGPSGCGLPDVIETPYLTGSGTLRVRGAGVALSLR